jgi:pimeloyl-ACP methyl ester carboxylesterase
MSGWIALQLILMTIQPVTISLPYISLACQRWTSGDVVIVALHGWMDNSNSFLPLAQISDGIDLLAVDFAGHGESEHRPAGTFYHLVDYVHDTLELLIKLDKGPVILMGHSLGGSIAQAVAAAYPKLVSKLILIDTPGPIVASPSKTVKNLEASLSMRLKSFQNQPGVPRKISLAQAITARINAGEMTKQSAELLMKRNLKRYQDAYTWQSDPRLRIYSPVRLTDEQADDIVNHLVCPTLLIEASDTFPLVRNAMHRRLPHYKNIQHKVVEGYHHVHMDAPERIWPMIQEFITKS